MNPNRTILTSCPKIPPPPVPSNINPRSEDARVVPYTHQTPPASPLTSTHASSKIPLPPRNVLLDHNLFLLPTHEVLRQCNLTTSIIEVAKTHGLALLEIEQFSWAHFLLPYGELDLQTWFINGHQILLACLSYFYALIHIPGTVTFIAWYYYVAPSHAVFATVRRTLTLTNLIAFIIFTLYPTMPPRLLPPQYGFLDSVHNDRAASVWVRGTFVNSLAAMPSMHFGYAAVIGATLIYQAITLHHRRSPELESVTHHHRRRCKTHLYLASFSHILFGILYPVTILLAIIATANHYWLDALVAALVAVLAYASNEIFLLLLPLEDVLLWVLRLEKPDPWTGEENWGGECWEERNVRREV